MKKKILTLIAVLATAASCAFSVTACGGNGNQSGRPEWTIKTAYAEAQDLGYEGTLEQFLEQIKGKDGADGKDGTGIQSVGIDSNGNLLITLTTGTQLNLGNVVGKDGQDGLNGSDGLSAYQIWLNNGHEGTEEDFLEWLKGDDGKGGVAGGNGAAGKDGSDGLSAYQIWLNNGHEGTEEDFLEWLKGDDGKGIDRIEKTSSDGLVDTYTIYFTDGTFTTFEITNGGTDQSQENTQGLDFYPLDDGTYGVACGNAKYLSEIEIPATYNGKAVTTIIDNAFSTCANLKSITIPDSIERIGTDAFADCAIESIYYQGTLSQWCKTPDLTGLMLSSGQSHSLYIQGQKLLGDIIIPDDVTAIGNAAFGYCSDITGISSMNSVSFIGNSAFESCTSLKEVKIGEHVTVINPGAFKKCTALAEIVIPESVNQLGAIRESYEQIPYVVGGYIPGVFGGCVSLKKVTLNSRLNSIANYTFQGCTALTSIKIPDSVNYIGEGAFNNTGLTEITIPQSITSINDRTFAMCTSLNKIEIPESVTSIGDYAFGWCSSLSEITIPKSVTKLGESVFQLCESLTKVTLNEGLLAIGSGTFTGCNSLKELSIPSSVTTIEYCTIISCSSLSKIIFNEGTQSIEGGALTDCPALKEIVIPKSITYIDSSAFEMCDNPSTIYYCGETEQWTKLNFKSNANVYYYSESQPTEEGNYWHYVDGVPTVW